MLFRSGAVAGLKTGIESLIENEKLEIKNLVGHGGFFKTSGAGQQIMASALHIPVSTLYNADLGGPNGMAILAAYMAERDEGESLEDFLSGKIYLAPIVHRRQKAASERRRRASGMDK